MRVGADSAVAHSADTIHIEESILNVDGESIKEYEEGGEVDGDDRRDE